MKQQPNNKKLVKTTLFVDRTTRKSKVKSEGNKFIGDNDL